MHAESKSGLYCVQALLIHRLIGHFLVQTHGNFYWFSIKQRVLGKTRQSVFGMYDPATVYCFMVHRIYLCTPSSVTMSQ